MRKFHSKEFLRKLRNEIPMIPLIKDVLEIPFKDHDDRFRFLCPLCKEFMTGINPNTNLARCFLCEKNFNPIDLVMTVKQYDFLDTVEYLKKVPFINN